VKKKILIVSFLLGISLFLIGTRAAKAAGSCSCTGGLSGALFVASNSCSSDSIATCTRSGTSLGNLSIGCDCIVSQPGANCVTSGVPPLGKTCCAGYFPESRSGVCLLNGTNPYGLGQPTPVPGSPGDKAITCGSNGINTAIGCLPVLGSTNEFLSSLLSWAVGVGSGVAFLLMLYAGFMIMTASGNPERIKAGQELMTSAVAGLILLIFSIFILRFIGVDILGLDAFGFGN